MKKRLIDILLVLGGILCLGMFIRNFFDQGFNSNAFDAIAKVRSGSFEQKRKGAILFTPAPPGTDLFLNDSVWSGPVNAAAAQIEFKEGSLLKVEPNTLLRLSQKTRGENTVELFAGEASVISSATKKLKVTRNDAPTGQAQGVAAPTPTAPLLTSPTASPALAPSTLPTATAPSAQPQTRGTRPLPNTIFYVASEAKEYEVSFTWQRKIPSGVLQLTDSSGKAVASVLVHTGPTNDGYVRRRLPVGKSYVWKINSPSGAIEVGPFTFQIQKYDPIKMSETLTPDGRGIPIEIVN